MKEVTLETERLILRMFREEDFEAYAKLTADPKVMQFIGGKTLDRLEAWRSMAFFIGHWHLRGYGQWAVVEKTSGNFLGRIGFMNPATWPAFELGWTLAREYWGRGYATEGARRCLEYGFKELNRPHIISLIHPDNQPSIRVAERLGEKVEGKTQLLGHEVLIYGIDHP